VNRSVPLCAAEQKIVFNYLIATRRGHHTTKHCATSSTNTSSDLNRLLKWATNTEERQCPRCSSGWGKEDQRSKLQPACLIVESCSDSTSGCRSAPAIKDRQLA